MYCPVCGEEIIIVSDFDIKLEDNIDMAHSPRPMNFRILRGYQLKRVQPIRKNVQNSLKPIQSMIIKPETEAVKQ